MLSFLRYRIKVVRLIPVLRATSTSPIPAQLMTEGIDYFTRSFISGKRNDLTAAEYRFGKAN